MFGEETCDISFGNRCQILWFELIWKFLKVVYSVNPVVQQQFFNLESGSMMGVSWVHCIKNGLESFTPLYDFFWVVLNNKDPLAFQDIFCLTLYEWNLTRMGWSFRFWFPVLCAHSILSELTWTSASLHASKINCSQFSLFSLLAILKNFKLFRLDVDSMEMILCSISAHFFSDLSNFISKSLFFLSSSVTVFVNALILSIFDEAKYTDFFRVFSLDWLELSNVFCQLA